MAKTEIQKKHLAIPENEFKLSLTMAGAVSAGCYTAGVMDYLFEMLQAWELAKGKTTDQFANKSKDEIEVSKTILLKPYQDDGDIVIPLNELEKYIPTHQVTIEAMGGASAGGMTTSMAAIYALNGSFKPVRKPLGSGVLSGNMLYDHWVMMEDEQKSNSTENEKQIRERTKKNTFAQLWDISDLASGKVRSFLNSNFVDNIAKKAFSGSGNIAERAKALPSYVSKNLQLVFSHCLLRGIPLEVNFETPISKSGRKTIIPNHTTYEHYMVTHYHLNNGQPLTADNKYLFLNPYDKPYKDTLKLATMATGAFPIGLNFRTFDQKQLNDEYLKNVLQRIVNGSFGQNTLQEVNLKNFPKNFSTVTVDGGAINNEPYREVLSILSETYGLTDTEYPSYGVVMIDPFPDMVDKDAQYQMPEDLFDVIPEVISTLTDQSRVKRREMLETDPKGFFRSIIFPRKWNKESGGLKPDKLPLACASIGAFGGFIDHSFREHDFFLGRTNARNFFRYFFTMPYSNPNNCHPIHKSWTPEMIEKFKIIREVKDENNKISEKIFLPIIPDLSLLFESDELRLKKRYQYAVDKPTIAPVQVYRQRKVMKKRLLEIFNLIAKRKYAPDKLKVKKKDNAQEWIKHYFHRNLIQRFFDAISEFFAWIFLKIAKRSAANKLTDYMIKTIIIELEKNKLLSKYDK